MRGKTRLLVLFCIIFFLFANIVSAARIYGTIYDLQLNEMKGVVVEIDTTPKQRFVSKEGAYEFSVPIGEYKIMAAYSEELTAEESIKIEKDGIYVFDLFLAQNTDEEEQFLEDINLPIPDRVIDESRSRLWAYIIVGALAIFIIAVFFKLIWKGEKTKREAREKGDAKKKEGIKKTRTRKTAQKRKKSEENSLHKEKKNEEKIGLEGAPEAEKIAEESLGETEGDAEDAVQKQVIEIIKKHDNRITQKELRKELPYSEAKISLIIAELEHGGKIKKIKKGRGNILVYHNHYGDEKRDEREYGEG